jgi:lysophospholipase L1-like esterase
MSRSRRPLVTLFLSVGILLIYASTAAAAAPSYVALGDSYASGDGTGVFYNDGTSCYRSPDAYPPLIAAADGYSLTFAACSGATSASVISGQLSSLNSTTSLVTVQIGGNDASFTTVMEDCALYYFPCSAAISTADSYIENTLPGNLNTLYTDIRADAPNAKVVVLGYPRLFTSTGTTCGINVLTSSHEKSLNTTADDLDGAVQSEATAHGFTYVDPRSAFSTHELCSSSPWLNNVKLPTYESYHPTIAGEAEFASLLKPAL